ncbi:MAG: hypothetical protein QMC95_08405 [Desulfitobacteriaceae bacterium]|nr:hypothetical protein [Desulfitobacteriaceae bacterium]MDI6878819.1 hypothetical protein [Desulfitobacteriaceae bacterium]MDI6914229.1 hypothetical protein [Desulfitobacteriaceae bacterium]
MQFTLTAAVPYPMGLERETAEIANTLRTKYDVFFRWVQEGELSPVPVKATESGLNSGPNREELGGAVNEPWLLESWDIEYFYGLSRPEDVRCACPYGWVEKVKRIVDQQYPIFGVERFPDLFAKGAHMAWLLLKNEVFPEYNGGIAALSILVLLQRNGYALEPSDEDLIQFIATVRKFLHVSDERDEAEDSAIGQLAGIIQSWKK